MKRQQRGFTLIELVMVIVILGILAAVALPKFLDLGSDAKTAAIQGAAGALSSYALTNYAAAAARGTGGTDVIRVSSATAGSALAAAMGSWDTKFSISTEFSCVGSTMGATGNVTVSYSGAATGTTAKATIVCTG